MSRPTTTLRQLLELAFHCGQMEVEDKTGDMDWRAEFERLLAQSEIERTNAAPPVAWRYRNAGGGWTYLGYPPVGLGALAEIEPLYALSEIGGTKHAFMDGIDWQHHLGIDNDPKGASLYPSVEDTVREKKCLAGGGGCGVVEVEVRLVRWVIEQDLDSEIRRVDKRTNAATQEGVSARDAMPSPAGSGPLPAVAAPDKESNE